MSSMIPLAAPAKRIERFSSLVQESVVRVLASSAYILGQEVERFEAEFASYLGAGHCVGVNSGTDALTLALRALGLKSGDEVITVAMTTSATAAAIAMAGGVPCFVDIDPVTRNIDLDRIAEMVTPRTVGLLPVHLHGNPVDMIRLMGIAERFGLWVVEDCAQAHGAFFGDQRVGSFGHVAAFSFYPTKNLGAVGDAGAVVTADGTIAASVRSLRMYGWRKLGISEEIGGNSRLDELQAAILSALLPHLDESNGERAAIADTYRAALCDLASLGEVDLPQKAAGSVYHQFVIGAHNRGALRQRLLELGIMTGVHYAVPLHCQLAFLHFPRADLPVTETLAARFISLPIQPEVVGSRAALIAERVTTAIRECRKL